MQVKKTPLNNALTMMNLKQTLDEDAPGSTETPCCKKPRLADKAERSLSLSPPAVVGPQTVP